jgi:hypothetical protein
MIHIKEKEGKLSLHQRVIKAWLMFCKVYVHLCLSVAQQVNDFRIYSSMRSYGGSHPDRKWSA